MDPSLRLRGTLYPQKLALTSSIRGGRSVGIVRSRTQAMEFSFFSFRYPDHSLRFGFQTEILYEFLISKSRAPSYKFHYSLPPLVGYCCSHKQRV
jgi:hypothetical protein